MLPPYFSKGDRKMRRGKFSPKNEIEKQFYDDFKQLAQHHNAWTVWSDFVDMTAYSIANSFESRKDVWEDREAAYLSIIKKYNKAEQELFPKLFGDVVLALEENPAQDFLGDLYMRMEFGDDWRAQIFTPWHLSEMMARMTLGEGLKEEVNRQGYISVYDPCCGSGVMLLAAAHVAKTQDVNYQQSIIFAGQDIDPLVARMCYIQMSLLGCPGYVAVGNTLSEPLLGSDLHPNYPADRLYFTPLFYVNRWCFRRQKVEETSAAGLIPFKRVLPAVRTLPSAYTISLDVIIKDILTNRRMKM